MKIEIRQSLGLQQILAPQLIQSLKMLQMPLLKLEQTLRQELAINPLLEEIDEPELEVEPVDLEAPEQEVVEPQENKDEPTSQIDWDAYLFDEQEGYRVREPHEPEEERFEGVARQSDNLYSHLLQQLSFLKLSEEEHLIGEYIIGNINPDGYLAISVSEMAAELKVDEAIIENTMKLIHRFDPTGVGSRDLRESLLIQLREKNQENTLAYKIVDEHLKDLEKKSDLQIARIIGVPIEKIQKAMIIIKGLSPTPTYGRFESGAMPVVPDLMVERYGEDYVVFHNDRNIPRLRINASYKDLIKRGGNSTKDTKDYIRQKLEQARWLLNAINQRRTTMIRVMEAIIEEQKEFFEKGPAFLKPLIMEEIAQIVDMNVATISRVSSGKYVQTPLGVYEIKYFFNSGIASENGEDVSKRSVKQRIEEIIKAEDSESPLSDQDIFKRLKEEKIQLARRTVTKYREELGIKPARFRKRVN
jgi:RNA polymerase sigma-54 factor